MFRLQTLVPIIGTILGFASFVWLAPNFTQNDVSNFALGNQTTISMARIQGSPIHCHDLSDLDDCIKTYREIGKNREVILWLGNSQLHAINQYQPGDKTAVEPLFFEQERNNEFLIALSQPNANLQEHLLLFLHLKNIIPVKRLIIPLVFDDMREDGIRENVSDVLQVQEAKDRLQESEIGRIIVQNSLNEEPSGGNMDALDGTVQKKVETYLNEKFSEIFPPWAERHKIRGKLITTVYQLRNKVFGIDASTKRKIIPGRYQKNKQALKELLSISSKDGIDVLTYIAPIRNDLPIPYEMKEYERFKDEMAVITLSSGAWFFNFENAIPNNLWGFKDNTSGGKTPEFDFMHFQSLGHKSFAITVAKALAEMEARN